jgi:hypothetical protein
MIYIAIQILFFFRLASLTESNVIGIDFGSDSFKVSIVQPGSPLDIGNISILKLMDNI